MCGLNIKKYIGQSLSADLLKQVKAELMNAGCDIVGIDAQGGGYSLELLEANGAECVIRFTHEHGTWEEIT